MYHHYSKNDPLIRKALYEAYSKNVPIVEILFCPKICTWIIF